MIGHREEWTGHIFDVQLIFCDEMLNDRNLNFVGVYVVIVTQIVDFHFALVIFSKVFYHVSERISVECFDTFARKSHGKSSRWNWSEIEIETCILVTFPILRNHFLNHSLPLASSSFAFSIFDTFNQLLVDTFWKIVNLFKVHNFWSWIKARYKEKKNENVLT